jgi:hypothetical protein
VEKPKKNLGGQFLTKDRNPEQAVDDSLKTKMDYRAISKNQSPSIHFYHTI